MTDDPQYEYDAFVSYRHRPDDRACAEWLVEALECFETPERLVREGYPVGFGRVFRDDDELRAEPALTPAIRRALYASRYLLVVCSPETPHSAWVRAEISLFQHWGRGENIIPILIDGDPGASFPPELTRTVVMGEGADAEFRTEVPRGPTLSSEQGKTEEELKERALLTIAATVLGIAFNKLRDRVEERVRKLTSVELFEQVAWRRGAPVGIGPVDEETAGRRHATWRFESRGGRVMRLSRINGSGYPAPDDEGVSVIDILYREDGGGEQVTRRNRHGVVKLRERYNADQSIVDFIHEDDSAAPTHALASGLGLAAEDDSRTGRSTVLRHLLDYDDAGFVVRRRFCRDTFNTPGPDGLGHFGQGFERDAHGQTLRTWALDANGMPMTQRNGVAFQVAIFGAPGRETDRAFHDADGKPLAIGEGFARRTQTYDVCGNLIEVAYLDEDGALTMAKYGCARVALAYDAHGNQTESIFLGVDGALTLNEYGCARATAAYDSCGNLFEIAYFGVDGAPAVIEDGFSRICFTHDAHGNRIEQAYFGEDGAPALCKDGYVRFTATYDIRGNRLEEASWGVDGAPVLNSVGVARFTNSYDARGNRIETACFGVDGAPTLHDDGFARLISSYDVRGNMIEQSVYGVNGELALYKNGFARITLSYDARGNLAEVGYFGVDGAPIVHKEGGARYTSRYDDRGNQIELAYFGLDGAPALDKDGCARYVATYDARGNLVGVAHFGVDGSLSPNTQGFARIASSYDAFGRRLANDYFGVDGKPVARRSVWQDDERFNGLFGEWQALILRGLFDEEELAALADGGFAHVERRLDPQGHEIERSYAGSDGGPANGPEGFSHIALEVDALGNPLEVVATRADGAQPLHLQFTYNARRQIERVAFFDPSGHPMVIKLGFATVEFLYDARHQRNETRYFDAEGGLLQSE